MAQRRMFSKRVIGTDRFMELSQTAQLLYFHLSMEGDDDGFVSSARRIARTIGCKESVLEQLHRASYIHIFESGIIVILDWRVHNTLQNDRYKETLYQEEKRMLRIGDNGRYHVIDPAELAEAEFEAQLDPECIQSVSETDPEWIQNGYEMDPEWNLNIT